MRLGDILIQEGVVSSSQVEDALDAQTLRGGRFGTNLVECGAADEAQLAAALGRQYGVLSAHGEIIPSPEALACLPRSYQDEHNVLPARLEGNKLYLLVMDPTDLPVQDHVAAVTGKRVVPIVVAEFRMAQLLRRYAGAYRPVRGVDLQVAQGLEPAARPADRAPAGPDLMSEADFQALYAAAAHGGVQNVPGAGEEAVDEADLPQIAGVAIDEGAPAAAPPAPELAPVTFAQAQEALDHVIDRDGAAQAVVRFAAGGSRRALLFQVQGDSAIGWMAAGAGMPPGVARAVALSLAAPSPFKLVRDSRSHFLGRLPVDAATAPFLQAIGGAPRTAALLPILAAGRVVNILYADNGPDQHASPELGELLIVAQKAGRAYEALIAERRSASRARPPKGSP